VPATFSYFYIQADYVTLRVRYYVSVTFILRYLTCLPRFLSFIFHHYVTFLARHVSVTFVFKHNVTLRVCCVFVLIVLFYFRRLWWLLVGLVSNMSTDSTKQSLCVCLVLYIQYEKQSYFLLQTSILVCNKTWLIDWLIGWLIDCLIDWLIGWLVDWLIGWLIDWLVGWLIDWLND